MSPGYMVRYRQCRPKVVAFGGVSSNGRAMMVFTRTDPSHNVRRFYVVSLAPTLFGEWTVLRESGRIGSPGTVRVMSFERQEDAEQAEELTIKRRLSHGYTVRNG